MENPTTRAQAQRLRYNKWGGSPQGTPYNPDNCAASVWSRHKLQCHHRPGHGPDGLYCKQHATEYFPDKEETWYALYDWDWGIREVLVVRHTASTVWVKGRGETQARKERRKTGNAAYFPTFDEAKQVLIDKAKASLLRCLKQAKELERVLDKAKRMRKARKLT